MLKLYLIYVYFVNALSKTETKDIPVIFLTGLTESGNELEGLSLGAVDYITKPFDPPVLLKRIEEIC
jgi:DNA-binding response OmpR family regulator